MFDNIVEILKPYLNSILIGFGGFLGAYILSQIVSRILAKPMGTGWSRFLGSLVGLAGVIWTLKLILESAGAVGFVVVLITAITGAFALGSERLASDLVGGVSLFFTQVYKPGDYVQIAGFEGKVVHTGLVFTTLENVAGDLIYIHNTDVTNATIINYSTQPGHLIFVKLILAVNQDINTAVKAIEGAIKGFSPALEQSNKNYSPKVVVESAAFGYISIEVRAYVPEALDYSSEKTRLYLLASNAVTNAGLKMAL